MLPGPLAVPLDGAWDAFFERDFGGETEQLFGPGDVGHVVGHFAQHGRGQGDLGLLAQRLTYVLGHRYEAVALAVRQVDRLVLYLALVQGVDARGYAAHAVVHMGEIKHLLLAVYGDRLLAGDAP